MKKIALLGSILLLLAFQFALDSDAELWDLIIQVTVENNVIYPGDAPVISGYVTDHASRPVPDVKVHVRSGQDSIFTTTDESGIFVVKLSQYNRIPGTYLVNVVGVAQDGKTGMGKTEFQVGGNLEAYSATEQMLSTKEAKKFLNSNPEDYENDSVGLRLYNYYQELLKQYQEEKNAAQMMSEEQLRIKQEKLIAQKLREQAINEFDPNEGVFSGFQYEQYVSRLDPNIKEVIAKQLNFTRDAYYDAKNIMNEILANGGTYEEARAAYLERISISQEELYAWDSTDAEETSTTVQEPESIETVPETIPKETIPNDISFEEIISKEDVIITANGSSIFVEVNGTTYEFVVNGTEISSAHTK